MNRIRLDKEEADLLDTYEAGEWRTIEGWEATTLRYQDYARGMLKRNKRVSVKLSSGDLAEIQKSALEQGIPYETLIASIIHKYVSGWLVEECEKA